MRRTGLVCLAALALSACTQTPQAHHPSPPHGRGFGQVIGLHMLDGSTGWAWGSRLVARTIDGAGSFVDVTPPDIDDTHLVMSAASLDDRHAWVVVGAPSLAAGGLTVDRTNDGGATWVQAAVGAGSTGADISFVDSLNGWLKLDRLAANGTVSQFTLMRTINGGATWSDVYHTAQHVSVQPGVQTGDCQWSTLRFATPLLGFAGLTCPGAGPPQMDVSHDGGQTWQRSNLAPLPRPIGVGMWSAVEAPRFFSEADGLTFWSLCVGEGPGCRYYGALYRTMDAGRSWSVGSVVRGTGAIVIDQTHAWVPYGCLGACSTNSTLLRTDDGGNQWTPEPLPPELGPNLHGSRLFEFANPTLGFVVVTQGFDPETHFYRTVDGGHTFAAFVPRLP